MGRGEGQGAIMPESKRTPRTASSGKRTPGMSVEQVSPDAPWTWDTEAIEEAREHKKEARRQMQLADKALNRAKKGGDPRALLEKGKNAEADPEKALNYYVKLTEIGHSQGVFNIGLLFEEIWKVTSAEADFEVAEAALQCCADIDHLWGCHYLGRLYWLRAKRAATDEEAEAWLRQAEGSLRAADTLLRETFVDGCPKTSHSLGLLYKTWSKKGLSKEGKKSLGAQCHKRAVDEGYRDEDEVHYRAKYAEPWVKAKRAQRRLMNAFLDDFFYGHRKLTAADRETGMRIVRRPSAS